MPSDRLPTETGRPSSVWSRATIAWYFYDWANSSFPTIILTFVFATYFTQGVAPNTTVGTVQWGHMLSASALAIAVLSPLVGAISDRGGRIKPLLALVTGLTVVASAGLWFVRPEPGSVWLALALVFLANIGFELGVVLYNALLPTVAPPERLGLVSGLGWGWGYVGGIVALGAALVLLIQADPPPFGLDKATAEHVRATNLLAALWFAVFALPLFLFVRDGKPHEIPLGTRLKSSFGDVARLLGEVRREPGVLRFLIANMIYIDGLNTLFAFGGIYAATTFGMQLDEVLMFGIALNLTAGLGAGAFAFLEDRIGAHRTIQIALIAVFLLGGGMLLVSAKSAFWAIGLGLGAFFGPLQSASRTRMAELAPEDKKTRLFGLLALSGKATAFLGPALLSFATDWTGSQRIGMATILIFFLAGLLLLGLNPTNPKDSLRRTAFLKG